MKYLSLEQQTLLGLLRKSLWGESSRIPEGVDWELVDRHAKEQGVISFAYDGAVAMDVEVPAAILQKWNNKMVQGVLRNERLLRAQDELVAWLSAAGIPAVILKGSSVARYYLQPDLRVLGDIDILVDESQIENARAIIEKHGYRFHESDHAFHLEFSRQGVCVELHYNVTKLPDSIGGRLTGEEIACFLNDIAEDTVAGHTFPVLSESYQALTLLLHMIRHMFSSGIGLRQMCDWAVYIAGTDPANFTNMTLPLFERCGILQYAKVATRTCVRYLGLSDDHLKWCVDIDDEQCRSFMEDVFCGGNMGDADQEKMRVFFTDSNAMGRKQTSVKALLVKLTQLSYQNFPFTKRCKILLPFFWVFLPVRYLIRSMLGLRPKRSVTKAVTASHKKRTLYEQLKPFELENQK